MLPEMNAERANRKRLIRKRVLGGAVALFVVVWLIIAVTLASGHDPALAAKSSSEHSNASQRRTATSSSFASRPAASPSPSPVVTQQS